MQIGAGLLGELVDTVQAVAAATRIAVLHPRALLATAEALREELSAAAGHPEVHLLEVPDGEDGEGPGRRGLRLVGARAGRIHP